jgi:hypothetical protein
VILAKPRPDSVRIPSMPDLVGALTVRGLRRDAAPGNQLARQEAGHTEQSLPSHLIDRRRPLPPRPGARTYHHNRL